MGSTLGSILGFAFIYSLGSAPYAMLDDWVYFFIGGGLINLPLSIFTGWGFFAIPIAWYLLTSLIQDRHPKPYLYLAVFYLGAITARFSGFNDQDHFFNWSSAPLLLPGLVFLGWRYQHELRSFIRCLKNRFIKPTV